MRRILAGSLIIDGPPAKVKVLSRNKIDVMKLLLTGIFCFVFNATYYPLVATASEVEVPVEEAEETTEYVVPELTVENVQKEIKRLGIKEGDIVLRQAILETGWLKCTNCSLGSNNLFGFFYKGKYLSFDNWVESVEYYKWWQDQVYHGGDYYVFLKKIGYAEAPNYIKYLKSLEGAY